MSQEKTIEKCFEDDSIRYVAKYFLTEVRARMDFVTKGRYDKEHPMYLFHPKLLNPKLGESDGDFEKRVETRIEKHSDRAYKRKSGEKLNKNTAKKVLDNDENYYVYYKKGKKNKKRKRKKIKYEKAIKKVIREVLHDNKFYLNKKPITEYRIKDLVNELKDELESFDDYKFMHKISGDFIKTVYKHADQRSLEEKSEEWIFGNKAMYYLYKYSPIIGSLTLGISSILSECGGSMAFFGGTELAGFGNEKKEAKFAKQWAGAWCLTLATGWFIGYGNPVDFWGTIYHAVLGLLGLYSISEYGVGKGSLVGLLTGLFRVMMFVGLNEPSAPWFKTDLQIFVEDLEKLIGQTDKTPYM